MYTLCYKYISIFCVMIVYILYCMLYHTCVWVSNMYVYVSYNVYAMIGG